MNSLGNGLKKFLFLFLASMILMTSIGCESLRKKFVRQKKQDQKEEFIPVLDPIDYPAAIHSPEQDYKKAYGLWKVWNREYLQEVDVNENDKRQRYLLNEAISQVEEMKKLVKEEKQAVFVPVLKDLNALRDSYETPAMVRRASATKRVAEQNAKIILNELNPVKMKDLLIE